MGKNKLFLIANMVIDLELKIIWLKSWWDLGIAINMKINASDREHFGTRNLLQYINHK